MSTEIDKPEQANDNCVGPSSSLAGKASSCAGCPNATICATPKPIDPSPNIIAQKTSHINSKVVVMSGKGGVGKSSFSLTLTRWLDACCIDIDLTPSIPLMSGTQKEVLHRTKSGIQPVYLSSGSVISIGHIGTESIYAGSTKTSILKSLLTDIDYSEIDSLVFDTPPGTSDEILTLTSLFKNLSIVLITSPHDLSLSDVSKQYNFCRKLKLNVLGVVINMDGFECKCGHKATVFDNADHVRAWADNNGLEVLGNIPLDPLLARSCDEGIDYLEEHGEINAAKKLIQVFEKIQEKLI